MENTQQQAEKTTVTIFVKILWSNKVHTIELKPSDQIEELAFTVEDLTEVPAEHLRISYRGRQVFCGHYYTEGEYALHSHTMASLCGDGMREHRFLVALRVAPEQEDENLKPLPFGGEAVAWSTDRGRF